MTLLRRIAPTLLLGMLLPAQAAEASKDGRIIYPKTMADCPPCQRDWLASRIKALTEGQPSASLSQPGKDGGRILFPQEIAQCEPCKRVWLSNRLKELGGGPEEAPAPAAQAPTTEDGAPRTPDGKVIYPKEIEHCEPCKRIWLANQLNARRKAKEAEKPRSE